MNLRNYIPESELRQLYSNEHWTIQELAEHFQVAETTIRRRMDELGIPTRARGPDIGAHHNFRFVDPIWSPALAYAVGIIATDGNLSPDGRHLCIRSADYELLETVKECLGLDNQITKTRRLLSVYYSLQWGDRAFYLWLESIGLMPAKSLILGALTLPDNFFPDFLRGVIDGDGCIRVYQDRWNTFKNPKYVYERVYVTIASGSFPFLAWIQGQTTRLCGVKGAIIKRAKKLPHYAQLWELKFAKKDSLTLLPWIYYGDDLPCLERKHILALRALGLADS
ncbi:MAG: DeoR family transcriptional regulator [Chloroflexi bacterium]|nr:DeoR family transcriptional regulator [Chloroflexota bacterium]